MMANVEFELPMNVEFTDVGPESDQWRWRMKACSSEVSSKRLRFTDAGLSTMAGTDPVPLAVRSHANGDEDLLSIIGFCDNRHIEDDWLICEGYFLKNSPDAAVLAACANEDENYAELIGGSIRGKITNPDSIRQSRDAEGPFMECDEWGHWMHLLMCPDYGAAIKGTRAELDTAATGGDWGGLLVAASASGETVTNPETGETGVRGFSSVVDPEPIDWDAQRELAVAFLFDEGDVQSDADFSVLVVAEDGDDVTVKPGESGFGSDVKRSGGVGTVLAGPKDGIPVGNLVAWEMTGTPTKITAGGKTHALVSPWDVIVTWPSDGQPFGVAATASVDPVSTVEMKDDVLQADGRVNVHAFHKAIDVSNGSSAEVQETKAPRLMDLYPEVYGVPAPDGLIQLTAGDITAPKEGESMADERVTLAARILDFVGIGTGDVAQTAEEDAEVEDVEETEDDEVVEDEVYVLSDEDADRIASLVAEKIAVDPVVDETEDEEAEEEESEEDEEESDEDGEVEQTDGDGGELEDLKTQVKALHVALASAPVSAQEPIAPGESGASAAEDDDWLMIDQFAPKGKDN
jgi:hypothetical protein